MQRNLTLLMACGLAAVFASASFAAPIVLVDEDFSVDAGVVTGGNAGAGQFTAGGGVGSLSGNGTDTFVSIGVDGIAFPELALGGELTFRVDNLGGAANDVTRWLQINVDGGNPFSGDKFGGTNAPALLVHDDDGGVAGSQTIAAGATDLALLFVTTVDFASTPLPAGEIARLGSFYAEFTPAIPEPTSAMLLVIGAAGFLARRK